MADYIQDPDNPNKQIPAPRGHNLFIEQPNQSFVAVMTTAQRTSGKSTKGTMIYDITLGKLYIHDGADWVSITKDA